MTDPLDAGIDYHASFGSRKSAGCGPREQGEQP